MRIRTRLGALFGVVGLLHLVGWGTLLAVAPRYPALIGPAVLAYTFGLRHAFDADHISAIDNTTRKLLQQGQKPLGVGFFFSLGHSTVVFGLAVGLAVATAVISANLGAFKQTGSLIGTSVSGLFLYVIAFLNLVILIDIARIFREMRTGRYNENELEGRLMARGFMSRFIGPLFRFVNKSWHMYPIGVLFGLGFDTATQVAVWAIAAGFASQGVPLYVIMALPVLFAAGMSLMDTADGAFMAQAYSWAFSNPVRKVYYNLTITGLSVLVALLVGTIELLSVVSGQLGLTGGFWNLVGNLNFNLIGMGIVAVFVIVWGSSLIIWKTQHIEERWSRMLHTSP
ncbi:MAG: HoxN/HupN/NixA family nickel/cobalt transporter [Chloroflexi bacterium]|nr:MAG: HoxN/HupN/NixA family nickel/cobalt transporter [Chloroflexota bacterium]